MLFHILCSVWDMTSRYWSWSQGSRPRPRSRLASNVRLRITALCPVFAFCCLSVGTAGILCQTKLSCSCVFSLHVVVSQCVCVWKDVCCSMHTQQYSTFLINVLQLAHVYTCRAPFYVFVSTHRMCLVMQMPLLKCWSCLGLKTQYWSRSSSWDLLQGLDNSSGWL